MNKLATSEANREMVWEINSNLKTTRTKTPKQKTSKEPVLVKTLIEKTFHRLSAQLLDRVGHLEEELKTLQAENAELKSKLSQVVG